MCYVLVLCFAAVTSKYLLLIVRAVRASRRSTISMVEDFLFSLIVTLSKEHDALSLLY